MMDKPAHDLLHPLDQNAQIALESGKILYVPHDNFQLSNTEQTLLTETLLKKGKKNISYDCKTKRLSGLAKQKGLSCRHHITHHLMQRYAEFTYERLKTLFPDYDQSVIWGRTSYRPAEIKGRATSKRKDDTRLHVDAFAATPVQGLRILRFFCNVNPYGEPRVWHVGESFEQVLQTFAPTIPTYSNARASLLNLLKLTKSKRSAYDHNMLHLHDNMKCDDHYQQTTLKHRIEFPPSSSWIVFSDHVSHAALSGQFLLEQTFYVPVEAMKHPELSPLKQWEALSGLHRHPN